MRVEFTRTISPFGPDLTKAVTSSPLKVRLFHSSGIETEEDRSKIEKIEVGENNHDKLNGHSVVVRSRSVDVPYPVRVVSEKANALLEDLQPNGNRHAVFDSTWEVLDAIGGVHSFNKPDTVIKRNEILQAIYDLQGQRISSDTGIGVIASDLSTIDLFHSSFLLGIINPNVDMGAAEQLVKAHPSVSGGLKAIDALSAGIIIPDQLMHFRIRHISPYAEPFIRGHIMRYDAAIHELTNDSVNNPWVMKMAHGIIPRK